MSNHLYSNAIDRFESTNSILFIIINIKITKNYPLEIFWTIREWELFYSLNIMNWFSLVQIIIKNVQTNTLQQKTQFVLIHSTYRFFSWFISYCSSSADGMMAIPSYPSLAHPSTSLAILTNIFYSSVSFLINIPTSISLQHSSNIALSLQMCFSKRVRIRRSGLGNFPRDVDWPNNFLLIT